MKEVNKIMWFAWCSSWSSSNIRRCCQISLISSQLMHCSEDDVLQLSYVIFAIIAMTFCITQMIISYTSYERDLFTLTKQQTLPNLINILEHLHCWDDNHHLHFQWYYTSQRCYQSILLALKMIGFIAHQITSITIRRKHLLQPRVTSRVLLTVQQQTDVKHTQKPTGVKLTNKQTDINLTVRRKT